MAEPGKDREPQRIAKLLARAGIASRRDIERMIEERRIAIDGVAVEKPATLLTSLHGVTVDGVAVKAPAPARLFRYHKPPGLLTAARDPGGRPTIYDRLPTDLPRVMPVGRLDMNTEGLLLLTTDGELKRQLELPSTGVERTYRARVFGDVSQEQLEELIHGVEIEGVRYGAIDANLERRTGRNGWVEMKLTEGKNREVRRVLEYLGLQVSRLLRIAYGPFTLGDLQPGEVDEIRQHDLIAFRKALDGKGRMPTPQEVEGARPPRTRPQPEPVARPAAASRTGRAAPSEVRASGRPRPDERPDRRTAPPRARPPRDDRPDRSPDRSTARTSRPRAEDTRAGTTRPNARDGRQQRDDRPGALIDRPRTRGSRPHANDTRSAASDRPTSRTSRPRTDDARGSAAGRPNAREGRPQRDDRSGTLVERPNSRGGRPRADETRGGASDRPTSRTGRPPRDERPNARTGRVRTDEARPAPRGGRPAPKGPRPTGRGAPKR